MSPLHAPRLSLSLRAAVLALPLLAAGLVPAQAQSAPPAANPTPTQVQAIRTACEADVSKLCGGIQPGGGRVVQCLRQQQEQVSPPCKASLAALGTNARKPAQ